MPALTRWFIKTSFVYFALALAAGLFLAIQSLYGLNILAGLFPVYIHLLVFGWLTQLVFGVVFWMFPKYTVEQPRHSEPLGWLTYVSLNVGLILRVIFEPIHTNQSSLFMGWMLVVSAILQFLSGLAFVINTWGRVKER